jgi:putative ABC transport system permease protein
MESVGGFARVDDQVFVPITTAESRFVANPAPGETLNVSQIIVQANDADSVEAAAAQTDVVLRLQHQVDFASDSDVSISNSQSIAETLEETTEVLVIFLGVIGGISLFVGGIGIMNIMLVSVTERTREIGIRRAIGARRSAVLLQFLAEATVLSVGGGLLGLLIGAIVTRQFSGVRFLNTTFDAQMSADVAILAMAVAAGIGLIAGFYPAWRAAALDPIDALRHE